MITHRRHDGSWALCMDAADCGLQFHMQDQTPEQLAMVPEALLYPLLEIMDPPTYVREDGVKVWSRVPGQTHRGYDLPAQIYPDGALRWLRDGEYHRDGERPAIVYDDGWREWWVDGVCVVIQHLPGGLYTIGENLRTREIATFPTGRFAELRAAALAAVDPPADIR